MPRENLQQLAKQGLSGLDYQTVRLTPTSRQLTQSIQRRLLKAAQLWCPLTSTTISAVVAQAVQSALSQGSIAAILPPRSADRHSCIEQAVASATDAITVDSGSSTCTGDVPSQAGCSDPEPHQVFSSISVGLTSRVSGKLKGKIWANEYIDFGSLVFSFPRNEGKYSLSMTPSAG